MKNTNISLGKYLKEQRELKGLSIDEAAMETNIAKKYIEALEQDEYGFFPAEMYITGFLTAYIEILELDRELVLSMYRRHMNKEQEAPLEAFYNFQPTYNNIPSKKIIRLSVFILLVLGMFGSLFVLLSQSNKSSHDKTNIFTEKTTVKQVSLAELTNASSITVGVRDVLVVMDDSKQKLLTVEFLGKESNKRIINFRIDRDRYSYRNGDILDTDINGDGNNDLRLEIISINAKDVEIQLNYTQSQPKTASFFDIAPYRSSIINTLLVANVTNIHTFNVTVTVTRPVWIAYQTDTVAEQEKLLNPGDNVKFSFIDGVKLSLGNAGAATITFAEFTNVIRGGTAGESSQSIFYKRTENGVSSLYRSQLK